jgi:2-C-methyl-D-erythritol 4-phosphate cytidylyltransferase
MTAVAVIVAAGRGERLGQDRPKALVPLAGRSLLEHAVDALRAVEEVVEIIVALPAEHLDAAPAGVRAVAGGSVRSQSVARGLAAARPDVDAVIVHDAARPLATPDLFRRALEALVATGADAVIAAAPVTDTIKQAAPDGHTVATTLERDRLWAVQTPQVFRRPALERALASGEADLARATDDAWLIERQGGTVRLLRSSPRNLKITTPLDLQVAEMLLARGASAG